MVQNLPPTTPSGKKGISEQDIKNLVQEIETKWLSSFILAVPDPADNTIKMHFNKIGTRDAMYSIIAMFNFAIDLELQRNPQYTATYVKVFLDLKEDFKKIIKKSNDKTAKYNLKTKPE